MASWETRIDASTHRRIDASTHRRIVGEVDRQTVGDLLRAPRRGPPPVLTTWLVPALPRSRQRPEHRRAARSADLAAEPVLHVAAQPVVDHELGGLRAAGSPLRLPLRDRCPVLQPTTRVAALRRSSRDTVEGARPIRRAISRTPPPWARSSAISSRSANDRYRPEGGTGPTAADMPPRCRNHRVPTGPDTPTATAASSLVRP